MENTIFKGFVRHRRYTPIKHEFKYKMFLPCIKLNEYKKLINTLPFTSDEKFNWISFYRKNYIGDPKVALQKSAKEIFQKNNVDVIGKEIFLIAHFSFFGYCFNPISLYLLCDKNNIAAMLVEVHNTPWNEKKTYVLTEPVCKSPSIYYFEIKKELHVSPFFLMDYIYRFHFKFTENQLILHMQSVKENVIEFDATLSLDGERLTRKSYLSCIFLHPFMTLKVTMGIYWQALLLFIKGVPLCPHPQKKSKK